MSNEMISVERGLLERACAVRNTANGWALSADAIRELRALLAKPAEQHHGEPVPFGWWRVPKDRPLQGMFLHYTPGQSENDIQNALDHGFAVDRLYARPAEQPAPVAVVLPSRDDSLGTAERDDYANGYRHGWNACIDEVARLSSPLEGWQLVPLELTDDMVVAFAEVWCSKRQALLDAYTAILAMAPKP